MLHITNGDSAGDRLIPCDEDALEGFRRLDATLERFRDRQEVGLWFEHDLFDSFS